MLGQSWGGFLAQEYTLTSPANLRGVILANTACAFQHFRDACGAWRAELPAEVEQTLLKYEATEDYTNAKYVEACEEFYRRHVCRVPFPEEVAKSFGEIESDPTVYHT